MENRVITKEVAEVMAKWWADKVTGKTVHDNGDNSFASMFAGALADDMVKQVTDVNKQKFIEALAKNIIEFPYMESSCIGCDYHPDRILSEAAKKAGISEFNFPWKTYMSVGCDPTGNFIITVREGYGAPPVDIYPIKE